MRLIDHYRQQLTEDFAHTREQMIHAICGDAKAMQELEGDFELWMDIDLDQLGKLLSDIAQLRASTRMPMPEDDYVDHMRNLRQLSHKRQAVSEMVEKAWFDRIVDYTSMQLSEEDLVALIQANRTPEPPEAA